MCIYVWVYACVRVFVCVSVHVCMNVCKCANVCVNVSVCTYVYAWVREYCECEYVHTCVCAYMWEYWVCERVLCVNVCNCECAYVCEYVCVLKVSRWKYIDHSSIKQKQAGMAVLISDKVNYRAKRNTLSWGGGVIN